MGNEQAAAAEKNAGTPAETATGNEIDLGPARLILQEFRAESGPQTPLHDKLIPLLQRIQEAYAYLPLAVLEWVSRDTGIPTSRMHGVITFYSQFYTEPRGKNTIQCCRGTACHVRGGARIGETLRQEIGLSGDGTTGDGMFSLESVACLGACALAPLVVVNSRYHGKMSSEKARRLVYNLKASKKKPDEK